MYVSDVIVMQMFLYINYLLHNTQLEILKSPRLTLFQHRDIIYLSTLVWNSTAFSMSVFVENMF
jgi:hypothetical protein